MEMPVVFALSRSTGTWDALRQCGLCLGTLALDVGGLALDEMDVCMCWKRRHPYALASAASAGPSLQLPICL
eukprot:16434411-Heterocapsa_arctica.AAC.1